MQRASTRDQRPTLVVLLGPTGVGKTALGVQLARQLGCSILSADSRQIYHELPIGTAAPTPEERAAVPHYFVGTHSVTERYSAASYEVDVLHLLEKLFSDHPIQLLSGGSMMYIDAVCRGIDEIPDVDPAIRAEVWYRYETGGLAPILSELEHLDPRYYATVDHHNYKRILHGYEVCLSSGRPFSSFHTGQAKSRPFDIIKVGLTREREDLYARIDERVLQMMSLGLEAEARAVYPYRHLNALNTVGYKELFAYFDGTIPLDEAIRLIQRNSRHYARKQLTWWKRDPEVHWYHPDAPNDLLRAIGHL
ncbi:tRNA (adenosine(37)-N6)-dimethylallyltransferase MiaA [Porphyromonas catoniae]|uniref:tRNA (adenosine(37)-N6)-dimethylallyltransferase MiaA n=1 Tax=Porphyromonas catoniae TaxID=41976 RepID=UPI0028D13CC8|nr:tRNA (adenosine(37)-N6)-dimethylallyltransferase MiaA [Porphyromonas catoniae]